MQLFLSGGMCACINSTHELVRAFYFHFEFKIQLIFIIFRFGQIIPVFNYERRFLWSNLNIKNNGNSSSNQNKSWNNNENSSQLRETEFLMDSRVLS